MKLKTLCATLLLANITHAASAETLLFDDVVIHSAEGVSEVQDVLIQGSKIKSVADSIAPPAGVTVIDGKGKVLTTGLFNAATHLGVAEIDQIATTVDVYSENTSVTAAVKIADAFNPDSVLLANNQINGLTHALVMPGSSASIFAGQTALVELGNTPRVVDDSVGVVVQLGEYGQQIAGGSRAAALALLREALDEAKDYSANKASVAQGNRRAYTNSYADLKALSPVVAGSKPLIVNVSRASDIKHVLKLAAQYRIKLILSGAQEGWKLATEIAAAKVPVIMDPIYNLPIAYESLGARLDNAMILDQAGVTLLFTGMSWHHTHNAYLVKQSAGNAVANGLALETAYAAMTVNPAQVFGLPVPQVKAGADATLVLWSGDPLELSSYPDLVMVRGERSPGMSRQLRLRDRYFAKLKQ